MTDKTLPILLTIRRKLPELSGNFRAIAEQILKKPESVLNERVSDLARRSHCDAAQVIRLCKKFGFDGFSSLKSHITHELLNQHRTLDKQIPAPESTFDQLKKKFAEDFSRTVNDTLNEIDESTMMAAVTKIQSARQILIAGFGSSGLVARDLQIKLLRLGFNALFLDDAENLRLMCAALSENSLLIAFSFSGSTEYLIDSAELARKGGATIIAFTNYPDSPLAATANLTLLTTADEQQLRLGAMASIISQHVAIDVLVSLLAMQDGEKARERILNIYQKSVDKRG
jgi:DNA-binding MurR/RpiR family transcriptional regulator